MFVGIGVGVGRQRFGGGGGFADAYFNRVTADGGTVESLTCVANASTLLQQASLLFIPSGYKAGVAYSALPNNGNGDLTWSRNSTANRTLANGNIGSVGANVPRLSYMYGSCPSALLEPQRTNLVVRSEEFDNASWSKQNGLSVTANTTTAPDGVSSADTLTASTSNFSSVRQNYTSQSAGTYTFSFYAKQNTKRWMYWVDQQGAGARVWFDLQNGVLGTVQSGYTAGMISIGNGWYRCVVTTTPTLPHAVFQIGISEANNGVNCTTTGSVFIWGAQMEAGAYATTYIPTTSATATRIADTFTRNNIYTNGLISASGGTWYVELKNNVAYLRDFAERFGVGDTSALDTNSIYIGANTVSSRAVIWKAVSGSFSLLYTLPTDTVKVAIKWNGTSADIFANGVKVVSATAFTTTNMQFLTRQLSGIPLFVQTMALYNTPLSDANCITLTT